MSTPVFVSKVTSKSNMAHEKKYVCTVYSDFTWCESAARFVLFCRNCLMKSQQQHANVP